MSSRRPTAARRGALGACVVVVLVTMTAILLSPGPVDRPLYGTALRGLRWLHGRGLPDWVDYSALEALANVVLFVPLGFLAGALLPARRWWLAVLLCTALATGIEGIQDAFLPRRQGNIQDGFLNACGALLGVAAVTVRRWPAGRRQRRRRVSPHRPRTGPGAGGEPAQGPG